MALSSHRARQILESVGRAYPHAWRLVDLMRAERGRALPQWPQWCFIPCADVGGIVSGGAGDIPFERGHHIAILAALAAWRMTQGIYRFDPALYEALIDTELDRELPREPLYRPPEWCVYIETPGLAWTLGSERRPIHGVWAHLDWDEPAAGEPREELRLLLDTAREPQEALDALHGRIPVPLILGEGAIADALERLVDSAAREARRRGLDPPADLLDARLVARALWPVVSLVLYLCSEEPEIGDGSARPGNPLPKRTRRGWRLFPADKPTTWNVGVRLGAALAAARLGEQTAREDQGGEGETRQRARPRAHIRRAHWHTFLAGAGRTEQRIKWLPPIGVNVRGAEDLPAVIRKVQP